MPRPIIRPEHPVPGGSRRPTFDLLRAPLARAPDQLWPRWLFLRALGLVFGSAFYALAFQIRGLVGARGVLPAAEYLPAVARAAPGAARFWLAPTAFWAAPNDTALLAVVAAGLAASALLALNVWPRVACAACAVCFLSCVGVLQDFSSYQSDGMLLEAGFLACFLAPPGRRPGLGGSSPPPRAAVFLLQWEWFRIYFESGVVKLASGDPHWRDLTAMDRYYETSPLPSWPGWYVQQLPHWYHAGTVLVTLAFELVLVWALFLGRRARIACCVAVTLFQLGIIATANYAFLNHLVLLLGVFLLDDRALAPVAAWARRLARRSAGRRSAPGDALGTRSADALGDGAAADRPAGWGARAAAAALAFTFVATLEPVLPAPLDAPARLLAPFRVANTYGLFATMTPAEYEIEFQGTRDRRTWAAYPFRYKPQDPREAPGIFAPYQPRFDWNLWFASLAPWRDSPWVVRAQLRLLEGSPDVLALFRADPFRGARPTAVRTVLWRYRFTTIAERRATGRWWARECVGPWSGTLARDSTGAVVFAPPPDDARP